MTPVSNWFERLYRRGGWPAEGTASGPGSTLAATEELRIFLPTVLSALSARSIADIPCGDFAYMSHVDLSCYEYTGYDAVATLIQLNRRKFPDYAFEVLDIVSEVPDTHDVVFVKDLFQHLSNNMIVTALANILDSGAEYLIVSCDTYPPPFVNEFDLSFEEDGHVSSSSRPVNLSVAPFGLGNPFLTLRLDYKYYDVYSIGGSPSRTEICSEIFRRVNDASRVLGVEPLPREVAPAFSILGVSPDSYVFPAGLELFSASGAVSVVKPLESVLAFLDRPVNVEDLVRVCSEEILRCGEESRDSTTWGECVVALLYLLGLVEGRPELDSASTARLLARVQTVAVQRQAPPWIQTMLLQVIAPSSVASLRRQVYDGRHLNEAIRQVRLTTGRTLGPDLEPGRFEPSARFGDGRASAAFLDT